jgi:cystathionine beta-lyase/cystathionine gamma-synthase
MHFDTRLVHDGQTPVPGTGDLVAPIHLSVAFDRSVQDPPRYFYGRGENPTREGLEQCLAGLEDVRHAVAYTSGQAAAEAALSLVGPGGRVVASDDVYGGTHALFELARARGVLVDQTDLADPVRRDQALDDRPVSLVWLETPTNPLLKIADIAAVAGRARERGALTLVDNTLASPALQQPLALGADLTLYSTTKFLAGHLDVLGGALVHDDPALQERLVSHRTTVGTAPGGLDCFLVQRGLRTLSLRVARQVANASAIADALAAEPSVATIRYPGRPDHPQYELGRRQMSAPGSLISFTYRGEPERLMAGVRIFAAAVSLGGVRSLIECPALMTHRPVPGDVRRRLGITDDLVRLSTGIEDPADLVEDLVGALRAAV